MRKLFVGFLLLTSISSFAQKAEAGMVLINASATYYQDGSNYWSQLTRLGIEKAAENKAIKECHSQQLSDCVIVGSTIDRCGTLEPDPRYSAIGSYAYVCSASATARGIK